MFSKQNLLATLAGTVAIFILGYLIWGIATMEFFEAHSNAEVMKAAEEVDMILILVGNFFTAFAMSTIYGKWANGNHSAGQGFKFGIWIGIFVGLGMGLLMMGTANMMDSTAHAVEAVLDIAFYGVVGAIIALVYKATAPKAAA